MSWPASHRLLSFIALGWPATRFSGQRKVLGVGMLRKLAKHLRGRPLSTDLARIHTTTIGEFAHDAQIFAVMNSIAIHAGFLEITPTIQDLRLHRDIKRFVRLVGNQAVPGGWQEPWRSFTRCRLAAGQLNAGWMPDVFRVADADLIEPVPAPGRRASSGLHRLVQMQENLRNLLFTTATG